MRWSQFICATVAALGGIASGRNVILESLPRIPEGWRKLREAPAGQQLTFRIALEQPNVALFEQTLYDISTPENSRYGRHLKRNEVKDILRPSTESTAAVLNWLHGAGISNNKIDDEGDWINFRTTVGQVNKMLNTTLAVYAYGNTRKIRALKYSVPEEIEPHITMIAPIIRFGQPKRMRSNIQEKIYDGPALETIQAAAVPPVTLNATACNTTITPECLRALYNIGPYQAEASPNSLFGVCGYLEVRHTDEQVLCSI